MSIEALTGSGLAWLYGDNRFCYDLVFSGIKKIINFKLAVFSGLFFGQAAYKHAMDYDATQDFAFALLILSFPIAIILHPAIFSSLISVPLCLTAIRCFRLYKNKEIPGWLATDLAVWAFLTLIQSFILSQVNAGQ